MRHTSKRVNTNASKRIHTGIPHTIHHMMLIGMLAIGATRTSHAAPLSQSHLATSKSVTVADIALASPVPEKAVALYSVFEMTLTASESLANPYKDNTDVTATFMGPGGIKQTVQGFWDGARTFKVRFTPTLQGTWTYSTRSINRPQDAGLSTSGTLVSVAAQAGNHGFLRQDPDNPSSFVFDDGTRYFMFGQTYYEIVLNALAGDKWKEAVNQSQAHGINKIRLLVYPWDNVQAQPYPYVEPFLGGNHDALNLAYWQKLDEVVQYLNSRGMLADLILFADSDTVFGTLNQDQRYLRYILSRYSAYPNVIWCLTNEWEYTGKSKSYWNSMGQIVREQDPWMLNKAKFLRPLSIHQQTRVDFQYLGSSWPTHIIIQYGIRNGKFSNGDAWGNYGIVYNLGHRMPVVNDEYGYIGELDATQSRNAIWGIATAGGYGSVGDLRKYNDGPNGELGVVYKTANWHDAAEYDDIKRLVDFWTRRSIQYWEMTVQNSRITFGTRTYALGNPGQEYVVYAAAGGAFSLDLPTGDYRVVRYNPRDGSETPLAPFSGGRKLFTMPDDKDWVVYIRSNARNSMPYSVYLPSVIR
jgi:hypothetical protein